MAVDHQLESSAPESPVAAPLQRIRAEYLEMPGLRLSAAQARRLWGLDCATCDAALAALVEAAFLSRTDDGLFVIAAIPPSGQVPRMGLVTPDPSALLGDDHARSDPGVASRGIRAVVMAEDGTTVDGALATIDF